jgi:protein-S-isoprenylcysteine O-methyltransferase Ste14
MSRSSDANYITVVWTLAMISTVAVSIATGDKTPMRLIIGFPLLGLGLILAVASALMLQKYAPGLATEGPYAWSRHPFYLGLLIMQAGVVTSLGSLWGMILLIISGCLSAARAKLEEKELQGLFPAEYASYKMRTPFFFGVSRYFEGR